MRCKGSILVSTTVAKTFVLSDLISPVQYVVIPIFILKFRVLMYTWASRRVASEHKHYLAGIDEILEKCAKAMRVLHISHRSFDTPIQSGMLNAYIHVINVELVHYVLVQGILITGRPGSGKTSIARAVAKMTESSALLTRAYSHIHE